MQCDFDSALRPLLHALCAVCARRIAPFTLTTTGRLIVRQGYAWDGPSGPTIDRATNMRGSLVHDVLYQCIRLGFLDLKWRTEADNILHNLWIQDGMWKWLAAIEVKLVRDLAENAARPSSEPQVMCAP
jgi:hypothetical protein